MGTSIAIICISTALLAWSWASYVSYKRVYEELADLNANLIVLRGRLAVLENLEQESWMKQRMFNESLEHQVWCTKKDVDSSMELLGNTKLSCFGKNAKKNKQFDAAMRHLIARRKWATHD